jgi:hypothetical protein
MIRKRCDQLWKRENQGLRARLELARSPFFWQIDQNGSGHSVPFGLVRNSISVVCGPALAPKFLLLIVFLHAFSLVVFHRQTLQSLENQFCRPSFDLCRWTSWLRIQFIEHVPLIIHFNSLRFFSVITLAGPSIPHFIAEAGTPPRSVVLL